MDFLPSAAPQTLAQSTTSAGMAPSFLPQAEQDRLNALNLQNMNPQLKSPDSFAPAGPAPKGYAEETPIGANNPITGLPWGTIATPQNSTVNPMTGQPWQIAPAGPAPTNNIIKETLVPDGKGGFYDTASPPPWMFQSPSTAAPNTGGLGSLSTPQQPPMPVMGNNPNVGVLAQQPSPVNNAAPTLTPTPGGLNSLARPQPRPFMRNQIAPRAGSLPSLRFNPTNRSLPVPFTRPAFRR
jgi:hypothetical protein